MCREGGEKAWVGNVRDANKMLLGWAIFDLRLKKIRMLNQLLVEDGTGKEFQFKMLITLKITMTVF